MNKNQNASNSMNIVNVEVVNYSKNDNIIDKYKITDNAEISKIEVELNRLKQMSDTPNLRASLGYIDLILNYKNNSHKQYEIIYTIYDGVIIQGSSNGYLMDRSFKNNKLEMLVVHLVPAKRR
ncbi:MAG TPA: hypothetical protein VKR53_16610 [Puia sp.]|nr:hypothetical protein [Puia sp.]